MSKFTSPDGHNRLVRFRSVEGLRISLLDQASGSIATGVAGGLAAAFASGDPLAIGVGVLAAASVPVIGTAVGRAFTAGFLEREFLVAILRYGLLTIESLDETFCAELDFSSLKLGFSIGEEVNSRLDRLEQLGVKIPRHSMVGDWNSSIIRAATEPEVRSWCSRLSEIDHIRVCVPAVHPAVVAAFKQMNELMCRFSGARSTIRLDYSSDRGVSLLGGVSEASPVDFIAVADSPLFHWDRSPLCELYRLALPISSALDFILGSKSTVGDPDNLKIVLYQNGTSAQDIAQRALKVGASKEIKVLPSHGITADNVPAALRAGLGMATIAPYWGRLIREPRLGLALVGKPLKTPTSLFAQNRWFTKGLQNYRVCFTNLFVHSWLWVLQHPQKAICKVLADKAFMGTFSELLHRR